MFWTMPLKTLPIAGPSRARMTITTTATNTRISAYSTRPCPFSFGRYNIGDFLLSCEIRRDIVRQHSNRKRLGSVLTGGLHPPRRFQYRGPPDSVRFDRSLVGLQHPEDEGDDHEQPDNRKDELTGIDTARFVRWTR